MPGPIATHKVFAAKIGARRRTELANYDQAVKAAKAQTTRNLNRGRFDRSMVSSYITQGDTDAFKRGVRGMAVRMGNSEQLATIERMDPEKLQNLYKNNSIVFDVYFDYGGTENVEGAVTRSARNERNVQFLIDTYTRVYGKP